jgi:hypothetical protein
MIYEELLTDPLEQKLQHNLTLVCKQTQAEFIDTLARLLGPKIYLVVDINSSSTYFQLGYNVSRDGQTGFHNIFNGKNTEKSWYTEWNLFHKGVIGRQILSRTRRVTIKWPFLDTTFWIYFEPGCAPDILMRSACRLASDARTRVTSKDAEKMLMETCEKWEINKAACSAEWTGVFIRDLRRGWNVLRKEASEARKRQAFLEHERRRAAREFMKRTGTKNPPFWCGRNRAEGWRAENILWKEVREAMRRGTLGRIKRQRTAGELAKCRASKGTSVIRQSQLSQCVVTNLEEGEPKLGKHGKPTISGAVSTYIVLRGRGEGREDASGTRR